MNVFLTTVALLAGVIAVHGFEPLHHWNFESAEPPVNELQGPWTQVAGALGQALVFDGYRTEIVRKAPAAKTPNGAFSITAWVAPQEYSWNLTAIINQQENFEKGYFFGIDHAGRLVGSVAMQDGWKKCVSQHSLPLLEWAHVAMVFDPATGLRLHLNGKADGEISFSGTPVFADSTPIALGKTQVQMSPANTERASSKAALSWMMFDGLMDEVSVHPSALSADEITQLHNAVLSASEQKWI